MKRYLRRCYYIIERRMAGHTMSKKKYKELKDKLSISFDDENINKILQNICDVLKFDPDEKTYDKEKGKKFMEWRKAHAEKLGISEYEYIYKKKRQNKST
jgi:hypothetical protein